MRFKNFLRMTAAVVLGGILFNAAPAYAELPTVDATVAAAVLTMQQAMGKAFDAVQTKITSTFTDLTDPTSLGTLLTNGFTQAANYSKVSLAGGAQIADASNTSNAMFQRTMRNAQIRDEHTTTPQACLSVDSHQVLAAAALQGWSAQTAISQITDLRGEGGFGQPAYGGSVQATTASAKMHNSRYCNELDVEAGLCTLSTSPNADQRATSLFGTDNLTDQTGVNAANDYGNTLIQPSVPASLRSSQLSSLLGQQEATRHRSYNARMSLARGTISYAIGVQAPGVTLTANQTAELVAQGIAPPATSSWLQVLSLEVSRRISDVNWAAGLQAMNPTAVAREIATEQAMNNYLLMQNYRVNLRNMTLLATMVAQHEEEAVHAVPIPTSTLAQQ